MERESAKRMREAMKSPQKSTGGGGFVARGAVAQHQRPDPTFDEVKRVPTPDYAPQPERQKRRIFGIDQGDQ